MPKCGSPSISATSWNTSTAISPTRPGQRAAQTQSCAGDVVLQLKTAYQDGTTHIVMSPLEFMQRLAALVPRPSSISFASTACSPLTPNTVPRSFPARRSAQRTPQRFTATQPTTGRHPASAGHGCSNLKYLFAAGSTNNKFLGDSRVDAYLPNGSGNSSQLTAELTQPF
jgi:hypothetical protein